MDKIPSRSKLALVYRKVLDRYEGSFNLPINDPNTYQILALLLSIFLLFTTNKLLIIVIVSIIMISDWFDGLVARKNGLVGRRGWMIDVFVDRISEGLIFIPILGIAAGKIFCFLYLVNILLSFYSIKSGKHLILALRFFYLIYLFATITGIF